MKIILYSITFGAFLAVSAIAEDSNHLKIGLGTDASLGLAVGAEYQIDMIVGNTQIKAGPAFYFSRWSEDREEINSYTETSSTYIFGVSANVYTQTNDPSLSFIYGAGAAFMANSWQETSPGDSSIGPLINGLYTDQQDNSGASVFLNAGVKKELSSDLAVELNVPMFFVPYYYGMAIAPAIIVSVVIPL